MKDTKYYTCAEVATKTGCKKRAVYRWCQAGYIKYFSPNGRDYLISEKDFEDFCNSPIGVLKIKRAKEAAANE